MKAFGKVVGYNLLAVLIYTMAVHLWMRLEDGGNNAMGVAILNAMALVGHVMICILLSIVYFVKGNNRVGQGFLLSVLVIALVGFSLCIGSTQLMPVHNYRDDYPMEYDLPADSGSAITDTLPAS